MRMNQIEPVTTEQSLNPLQLKQNEKRDHSIAQRVLLEVCENTTAIGEVLPSQSAVTVADDPDAIHILY